MTLKSTQVVMLSTNQKAALTLGISGVLHLGHSHPENNQYKNQHLYFLSDEKIEKGDWFYAGEGSIPEQATKIDGRLVNGLLKEFCKKIITTTDKSLTIGVNQCDGCNAGLPLVGNIHKDEQFFGIACTRHRYLKSLPEPSPDFIKAYVEAYNKGNVITRVNVEYDGEQLKLNSKNEISIHKVKDSWNFEEVKSLIHKYRIEMGVNGDCNEDDCNKWCEINL